MSPDPCPRRAGDPASKPPVPSASGCGQHSPCQDQRLVRHTRAALLAVGTDRGLQGGDPDRDLEVLWRPAASGRRCSSGKVKFGGRGPQLEHPDAARPGQTGACPGAPSGQARLCAPGRRSPARRAACAPDLLSGWPSGLRRCVQVAVSPGGVGSNPTPDKLAFCHSTAPHPTARDPASPSSFLNLSRASAPLDSEAFPHRPGSAREPSPQHQPTSAVGERAGGWLVVLLPRVGGGRVSRR